MPPSTLAALAVVELELSATEGVKTSEFGRPGITTAAIGGFCGGSAI